MTIYIYSNETGKQVGSHTAQSVTDCENWGRANYSGEHYHWTYVDLVVSDRFPPTFLIKKPLDN